LPAGIAPPHLVNEDHRAEHCTTAQQPREWLVGIRYGNREHDYREGEDDAEQDDEADRSNR
jgi:hypothetical protein